MEFSKVFLNSFFESVNLNILKTVAKQRTKMELEKPFG